MARHGRSEGGFRGEGPGTRWLRGGDWRRDRRRGNPLWQFLEPQMGQNNFGLQQNPDGSFSAMHSPQNSNSWDNNMGTGSLQQIMQMLQQMAGGGAGAGAGANVQPGGPAPRPTFGGYPTNTNAPPEYFNPPTAANPAPPTPAARAANPYQGLTSALNQSVPPMYGPPAPSTPRAAQTAAADDSTAAWGMDT
jgi:hypothetical protein